MATARSGPQPAGLPAERIVRVGGGAILHGPPHDHGVLAVVVVVAAPAPGGVEAALLVEA